MGAYYLRLKLLSIGELRPAKDSKRVIVYLRPSIPIFIT